MRMPRLIGSGRAEVAGVDCSPKLDLPTSRRVMAQAGILIAVTQLVVFAVAVLVFRHSDGDGGGWLRAGENALREFKSLAGEESLRRQLFDHLS